LLVEEAARRASHILLVDDFNWGLACDEIGDVIWLSADDVKWRQNKRQRPWLAGTAIQQMCALIDTEVFADMLNLQIARETSS
jgi:purine-binding chemotaxis protein CheW